MLLLLLVLFVIATHGFPIGAHHSINATTAIINCGDVNGDSFSEGVDICVHRQRLVNHVSLILCNLNVKSIYLFYDNALKTPLVEHLMRDNKHCEAPIVTLAK